MGRAGKPALAYGRVRHPPHKKLLDVFLSRSQSPTGNAFREALPQDLRQSRNDIHFEPEAGNEILKGFWLNLIQMLRHPPHKKLLDVF